MKSNWHLIIAHFSQAICVFNTREEWVKVSLQFWPNGIEYLDSKRSINSFLKCPVVSAIMAFIYRHALLSQYVVSYCPFFKIKQKDLAPFCSLYRLVIALQQKSNELFIILKGAFKKQSPFSPTVILVDQNAGGAIKKRIFLSKTSIKSDNRKLIFFICVCTFSPSSLMECLSPLFTEH